MTEFSFDVEAAAELSEAAGWYEGRRKGLGTEFLSEVERAIITIRTHTRSFPRLVDPSDRFEVRRALVARFPYALVFLVTSDEIRILAAAHFRRDSGYWLNRLDG